MSTVGRQFQEASPTNVDDAYNALKSYLMLADKSHAEGSHLNDQLPRHWRAWLENNRGAMPREQMIHSAERLMTFYLAQIPDPAWPRIDPKLALVDQARENLRRVVRGMPARERVYADVRARANTRFPSMTVARMVGEQDQALVTGSYAVPGAYTRDAWEKFVQDAFRDAASRELQSTDWVLKTAARDDLTLEGSPEQIQKGLTDLYPLVDDVDYDQRIGNLFWLLARTPPLVLECAAETPQLSDAEYCLSSLIALERVVDTQLGADGPGFSPAKDAVQAVIGTLAPLGNVVMVADAGQATLGNAVIPTGTGLQNRTQALQQLRLVADFFRRTEPHSPVAYLAERAASWGDMPLHVWLRSVIRDPAILAGMDELLAVPKAVE
jgi:hypothetical protein